MFKLLIQHKTDVCLVFSLQATSAPWQSSSRRRTLNRGSMSLNVRPSDLLSSSLQLLILTLNTPFEVLTRSFVLSSHAAIELSCMIESITTSSPRIEWKKIKNGEPSYVYFEKKIAGKLYNTLLNTMPYNTLIRNILQ